MKNENKIVSHILEVANIYKQLFSSKERIDCRQYELNWVAFWLICLVTGFVSTPIIAGMFILVIFTAYISAVRRRCLTIGVRPLWIILLFYLIVPLICSARYISVHYTDFYKEYKCLKYGYTTCMLLWFGINIWLITHDEDNHEQ